MEAQGAAQEPRPAVPKQTHWQPSLPTRPFLKRPLASRAARFFFTRNKSLVTRHSAGWRLLSTLDAGRSARSGTGLCKHIANSLRERPCSCSRRSTLVTRPPKAQGCGWLAKRGDVLEKHPKARLRVGLQNSSGIRVANQPRVFWETNLFDILRDHP